VNLRIIGSGVVLLLVLLGCASGGWKSESTAAPDADVAAYETFGWLPAQAAPGAEGGGEAPASIVDQNLRSAIRTQLVEKGYREVEASPEFRVGVETTTRLKEKTSPPVTVGIGTGWWGGYVGTSVGASVPVGGGDVKTVGETQITIRAVDPKGNRELWLGTTTGEVKEGADASVVQEAVADLLDDFPARRR
jgi:hypothetical protein